MGEQKKPSLIDRVAAKIVDGRQVVLVVTVILLVASFFTRKWVHVEDDLAEYLPKTSSTRVALDLMDENFTTFGTASVMVENVTLGEAQVLCDRIEAMDGVQSVSFDETADHYNAAAALYDITFDYDEDDEACLTKLEEIKSLLSSYDIYISTSLGNTAGDIIDAEVQVIMVYVAVIVVAVLLFTSETFAEVPVLLLTFVTAMILNSGCNFVLGTISFVSNSVTSILQLALSLDYAIILINHFKEEYRALALREAVISALSKAIVEISASSLTTIGGLFAMMFMQFRLGPDMAVCLIKAILFAMLSVFIVMPCLLMMFGPYLEKTRHRSFIPRIDFVGKYAYATRRIVTPAFVVVVVAACVIAQRCPYVYGYDEITTPKLNYVQIADDKIEETFGSQNLVAVVVPAGSYDAEKAFLEEMQTYDEVEDVQGLASTELKDGYMVTDSLSARELADLLDVDRSVIAAAYYAYADDNNQLGRMLEDMESYRVPVLDLLTYAFDKADDNGLDLAALGIEIEDDDGETTRLEDLREDLDNAKLQLMSDNYDRMLVYLTLPESGDETYAFIDEMQQIAQSYFPEGGVYIAGDSTTDYDFQKSFSVDNKVVSLVSITIVLVVLLFTFKSVGLSVVLVMFIQGSIWINFAIPALINSPLMFMAYLVVSSIQMGANIDYAIVVSSRYQEVKKRLDPRSAIIETMNFAFPTILTSGSILATSGILIGQMTSEASIVGIGQSLGRGTIISMFLVMFALPQILLVGNVLIDSTVFSTPKPKIEKTRTAGRMHLDGMVDGEIHGRIKGRVQGIVEGDMNLTVVSGTAQKEEQQ